MLSGDPDDEQRANIAHEHPPDLESGQSSPSSSLPSYLKSTANAHPNHTAHRRRSKSASRHRSHTTEGSSSHLLARLIARDEEVREVNALLAVANERLETETSRANAAERRALEYFSRLKSTTESKDRSDQEAARLREELKLYQLQLENAQKEIFRAQDIINQVSAQRNEAEADAARARTKARKLQEEKLVMLAREEGRRQGYQEGLTRGRRMGFQEARVLREPEESLPSQSRRVALSDEMADVDDSEQINEQGLETTEVERPDPPQLRSRTPNRSQYMRPGSAPPVRTYDTARHAPPPPIPTLVTPLPVRSPSHERRTPSPDSDAEGPEIIRPIPVSPGNTLQPPPEGWIPMADPRTDYIPVPPPHGLSVRIAASPSTTTTELQDRREARPTHPPEPPSNPIPDPYPPVRSRDYAYQPPVYAPVQHGHASSAASRASTQVSQYDLVSAPSRRGTATPLRYELYGRTRSGSQPTRPAARTDRHAYPSRESLVEQWRADPDVVSTATPTRNQSRSYTLPPVPSHYHPQYYYYYAHPPPYADVGGRSNTPVPTEPTAQLEHPPSHESSNRDNQRPRMRQRESSSATIPDIVVESPTDSASSASPASHGTVAHPELLSPESANRPLPRDDGARSQVQTSSNSHRQQDDQRQTQSHPLPHPYQYYRHHQHQPLFNPYAPPNRSGTPTGTVLVPQERSDGVRRETDGRSPRWGASKSSGDYEASPVPVGVVYPETPIRPGTSHLQHPRREAERDRDRNRNSDRDADGSRTRPRTEVRERDSEMGGSGATEELRSQSPAPLARPISLFDGE
ncbi:hypothetical protein V8B97DRAFT_1915832 [Scleroderma yunnanense]